MEKTGIFNAAASFSKCWNTKILRFNGFFSINNLPKKIKDEANLIKLDEYARCRYVLDCFIL